jgi:NADH-quinone oxidoreductase subunit F
MLDLPVDYETLSQAGSIIGSGGMIVMDEDTCVVDSAKYFLDFTMMESCGKCIPCRWGNRQLLDILEDITNGRGKPDDIDLLIELSEGVKSGSLCGLGQTAPNPVLSTIRYFRDEYELHIKKHRCSAAACRGLVEAPCSHTCPAGVDVPRYIRCIADGRYDEAVAVIRESIPFPSVCGYVCFHPCERKCRRALIDEPIAVQELKRFAMNHASRNVIYMQKLVRSTGKHVAVVGSGPSGLTAAYYLAKLCGHEVTVFEALSELGGMLRVGIPRYRLPVAVLDAEIDSIRKLGVSIRTNTRVDSLDRLQEQGFDALYLAPGAHAGLKLGIPGEEASMVIDCAAFLRRVSSGDRPDVGRRVAVIGGGNAAIDACRTALRLGAREVAILYRRTREEMPAAAEEIAAALEEGARIDFLVAPVEIASEDGQLRMKCIRMRPGKTDSSGRRRPEPIAGSELWMDFDSIIAAIGQHPEIPGGFGVGVSRWGLVSIDPDTLQTSVAGVFAGGDAVSGPASVIEAIAAGKQAAIAIDVYLGGTGSIQEMLAPPENKLSLPEPQEEQEPQHRPEPAKLPLDVRLKSFALVEQGLTEEQAVYEAARCLQCDLEKYHDNLELNAAEQG